MIQRHGARRARRASALLLLMVSAILCLAPTPVRAQSAPATIPALTAPVNDFAHVIDAASAQQIEQTIRALMAASGDVIVVATVQTIQPYGDIRDYAVRMFQNGGRGIGERGKDNGLLILLAVTERRVWVEVGYAIEPFITDGFSGQVSRELMTPEFRNGRYGAGLLAGTNAIAARIAQARNVQLTGVQAPQLRSRPTPRLPVNWIVILIVILIIIGRSSGGGRGIRRGGGWSGWSSGVGPFGGGGFGGGFGGGGGGFGGGFGGFGGGRSGGGGGGAGW